MLMKLIPASHGQFVVDALGHEHLMQVDVADVKRRGAAAEIQIPHADKFFAPFGCNLIMDLLEIIVPAHEGLVIVTAQAFDVDDPEIAVVGRR